MRTPELPERRLTPAHPGGSTARPIAAMGNPYRTKALQGSYRGIIRCADKACQVTMHCRNSSAENASRACGDHPVAVLSFRSRRTAVQQAECARSSGDRAFGCGPKGRGFKSLRAYLRRPSLCEGFCVPANLLTTVIGALFRVRYTSRRRGVRVVEGADLENRCG